MHFHPILSGARHLRAHLLPGAQVQRQADKSAKAAGQAAASTYRKPMQLAERLKMEAKSAVKGDKSEK